jgi:hypothetical protein
MGCDHGTFSPLSESPRGYQYILEALLAWRSLQGALLPRYTGAVTRRKNPHAVALGQKGGKKGGPKGGRARWVGLSPEERSELMRRAAQARWRKAKKTGSG